MLDPRILSLAEPSDVAVHALGDDLHVVVIDGFYREPERLRELALALDAAAWQPRRGFPGVDARLEVDTSELFASISRYVGVAISAASESSNKLVLSTLTGVDGELDPRAMQRPHFDGHSDIAGLVYLNPPAACRGGTAFYRHRRSGLVAWPQTLEDVAAVARRLELHPEDAPPRVSQLALLRYLFDPTEQLGAGLITESNAAWELTKLVEMRFNRAIFYSTQLFHSAFVRPGDFGAERRLTQTLFLRVA